MVMDSSLTIRNLASTPFTLASIERFEDPQSLQSKAGGYFFKSKSTTSAALTSPQLGNHAQSFKREELDVTLAPFESYRFHQLEQDQSKDVPVLSTTTLRLTIISPDGERHRIDTNPSYTQRSTQPMIPLSPNPTTTYSTLFHPSKATNPPLLTIHTNHLPNYCDWMSSLPDTLPLSALSIPGTHNSHTHYRALPSVRCQLVPIATQLSHGIRFLDIRLQPAHTTDATKPNLYLVHGAFPVSLTGPKYFSPILQTCYDFLTTHPRETILISLKREGPGSATDAHLATILETHYIAPHRARWYTAPTIPYLGAVRGKLVLVRRYHTPSSLPPAHTGLDATPWPHSTPHALFPVESALAPVFCLQDFCDVVEPGLIPVKLAHCTSHLARAAGQVHHIPGTNTDVVNPVPPGPLYLNFLSASNFWKRGCWPEVVAGVVNKGVEEWVCRGFGVEGDGSVVEGDKSAGVVVMDFVGEGGDWELVRLVVGMNMGVLMKVAGG